MTTVILVIIGILIAAASAFFLIFYGGDAYSESEAKAEAARLVNEGVQIEAAFQAFKAQEDRTPGEGDGVDYTAMKDLVCNKYLTQIPQGAVGGPSPSFDCASTTIPADQSSGWKIDYNYGIARSVIGTALNDDGSPSNSYKICQAARVQRGLTGDPMRCDNPSIPKREPCCIMNGDDV
jgi:hypothetical protein